MVPVLIHVAMSSKMVSGLITSSLLEPAPAASTGGAYTSALHAIWWPKRSSGIALRHEPLSSKSITVPQEKRSFPLEWSPSSSRIGGSSLRMPSTNWSIDAANRPSLSGGGASGKWPRSHLDRATGRTSEMSSCVITVGRS